MATVEALAEIAGVRLVTLEAHHDARGSFVETFRAEWFPGRPSMVQANVAERRAGTVVGLHYHLRQSDYWYVTRGRAQIVLHDLRAGSPTEGTTWSAELDAADATDERVGVYIPPGVAHGLAAVSDAQVAYLVDQTYDPADELAIAWDDPDVGAPWRVADPILSDRDRTNPTRAALPIDRLPRAADA